MACAILSDIEGPVMFIPYLLFIVLNLFIFFDPVQARVNPEDLNPFETDGCTSYPNGTSEEPSLWLHCCVQHDLKYWAGGTEIERLAADEAMYDCVSETGYVDDAYIMYKGVRIGGTPYFDTDYRWGFGWNYSRDYGPLNKEEKALIKKQSPPELSKVPIKD